MIFVRLCVFNRTVNFDFLASTLNCILISKSTVRGVRIVAVKSRFGNAALYAALWERPAEPLPTDCGITETAWSGDNASFGTAAL